MPDRLSHPGGLLGRPGRLGLPCQVGACPRPGEPASRSTWEPVGQPACGVSDWRQLRAAMSEGVSAGGLPLPGGCTDRLGLLMWWKCFSIGADICLIHIPVLEECTYFTQNIML